MRLFMLALLSLFVVSQLLACASSSSSPDSPHYYKVYDRFPRLSPMGFSLKPPLGKNWFEAVIKNDLIYRKKVGDKDYAIQSRACQLVFASSEVSHTTLRQVIRQRHGKHDSRYRHLTLKTAEAPGRPGCALYALSYDERANATSVVHVSSYGLVCSHPEKPKNGIEVSYQEQWAKGTRDPSFRKEAETFLNSLTVRPLDATTLASVPAPPQLDLTVFQRSQQTMARSSPVTDEASDSFNR